MRDTAEDLWAMGDAALADEMDAWIEENGIRGPLGAPWGVTAETLRTRMRVCKEFPAKRFWRLPGVAFGVYEELRRIPDSYPQVRRDLLYLREDWTIELMKGAVDRWLSSYALFLDQASRA